MTHVFMKKTMKKNRLVTHLETIFSYSVFGAESIAYFSSPEVTRGYCAYLYEQSFIRSFGEALHTKGLSISKHIRAMHVPGRFRLLQ